MTKGPSEGRVRKALGAMELPHLVFKPPDDSQNWRPSDYIVWWRARGVVPYSGFIEVKAARQVATFPLSELTQGQRLGIREATRMHLPYWVVIWWPKPKRWTISSGAKILEVEDEGRRLGMAPATSVPYRFLASVAGIDCESADLPMILRATLLGELD